MKKFVLMAVSLAVFGAMFIVSPDVNEHPNRIVLYTDIDTGH
ncbi:hypothetical protein YDYSG_62490 [Paenibacillus tyrfis]|nr:hypothetical protein [Paenibacillus tyrfis]GLI10216.1 hypothetical protein YDYSG_62490 [Paenibacillus tyrfis]